MRNEGGIQARHLPMAKPELVQNAALDDAAIDSGLLARLRQRDPAAILEAYDRYQGAIYRFVWQMSGDAGAAADITQEVFLKLLEAPGPVGQLFRRFDPEKGGLEAYLLGVARKLARKLQVKEGRWTSLDLESEAYLAASQTEEVDSGFTVARLRAAIARLPVKYREVLVLCCLEERSYEQVAAIVGTSMGTIASRLSRARKLLVERMVPPAGSRATEKTRAQEQRGQKDSHER